MINVDKLANRINSLPTSRRAAIIRQLRAELAERRAASSGFSRISPEAYTGFAGYAFKGGKASGK